MLKKTSGSDGFDTDDEAAFVDALSTLLRRRRNLDLLHSHRRDAHAAIASPRKRRCTSSSSDKARRASLRKCREWLAEEIIRHEWLKGLWPPAPAPASPPASPTGGDPVQQEQHQPEQESDSCSTKPSTCGDASRATPSKRAHAEDRHSACSSDEDSSTHDAGYSSSSSAAAATEKHVFSMCAKKSPPTRKQKRKKREMTSYEATLLRARKKLLAAKEKTTTKQEDAAAKPSKEKPAASNASTGSESQKGTVSSKGGSTSTEVSSIDSKRVYGKRYNDSKKDTEFELNRKRILSELAAKGTPWPFTGAHNKFTKLTLPMLTHLFPTALDTAPAKTPVPAKEAPNQTVSSATSHAYHRPRVVEEVEAFQEIKFPKPKEVPFFRRATPTKKSEGCGDRSRGVPAHILRPSGEGPAPTTQHHVNSAPHSSLQPRGSSTFSTPTNTRKDPFPKVVALLPRQSRLRPFRPSSPKLPALFQKWARMSGASSGGPGAAHASMWRRVAGTSSTYGLRSDRRVRKTSTEPATYPMDHGLRHAPVYRPPARHGTRRRTTSSDLHMH